MSGSVTVITLTRQRIELLQRAIASVKSQDFQGKITHLVLIDGCRATRSALEKAQGLPEWLVWRWVPQDSIEQPLPQKLARFRNLGVRLADSDWVCFLDDDNEFEPNHLSSLASCVERTGFRAVHSYEKIFWRDGRPYVEPRIAWCRDPKEGERQYAELLAKGVFQSGSNVSRDRADPLGHPDPARTVDMGEWLFERELLLEYPFPENYTEEDWQNITTEDDKLMLKLINHGIEVGCTGMATLRYYLGGFTNAFDEAMS